MTTLKLNQTVYTSTGLEGTVLEINGMKALVDFNGTSKVMLTMLLKSEPIVRKSKKTEVEVKETFNSVVNNLVGNSRSSMFSFSDIYTEIEKVAFTKNHFAGSIIEDARNGKNITKKQAQVVAFFAKENGLINS